MNLENHQDLVKDMVGNSSGFGEATQGIRVRLNDDRMCGSSKMGNRRTTDRCKRDRLLGSVPLNCLLAKVILSLY